MLTETEVEPYAVADLIDAGAPHVEEETVLDELLRAPKVLALLFVDGRRHRRECHDVAVALRECLKSYPSTLQAGIVPEATTALDVRCRVVSRPTLVLMHAGEVIEVICGVRDWSDYAVALGRYLGEPERGAA